MIIYLCGPVERDANAGDWRERYELELPKRGFKNLTFLNPLKKPDGMIDEATWPQNRYWDEYYKARNQGRTTDGLESAYRGMKACIDMCRKMVEDCDLVVCRLTPTFTVGTIEELVLAKRFGKKVTFVCPEGVPSFWLLVEFAPDPHRITDVFLHSDEEFFDRFQGELTCAQT